MSACPEFLPLLLEAEPAELRGEGASPLAAHLRSCTACARAAARVLEETSALDAWLDAAPPPGAVGEILARAGVGAPPPPSGEAATTEARRPRPLRSRAWWPLAAAAMAAGLLFVSRDRVPAPAPRPGGAAAAGALAATPPLVRAAPGQSVAVFQTDDPDITVLWFF